MVLFQVSLLLLLGACELVDVCLHILMFTMNSTSKSTMPLYIYQRVVVKEIYVYPSPVKTETEVSKFSVSKCSVFTS